MGKRHAQAVAATAILAAALAGPGAAQELPYVNFENHPQRALDLSPDGQWLAVAHTADQRVLLYRLGAFGPVPAGSVVVGVDPVAVRFRDNNELWVANHVSDSISIVDPIRRQVRATLATGDEPFDIAFAGERAFVSASQVNQVWVYALADLAQPPQVVAIDAEDPRALAVSADGHEIAVAIFESGNGSTILGGGLESDSPILAVPNVVSDPRGPYGGINPPPNAGAGFDPPRDTSATPPAVGLIVRQDGEGRWRDDNAADWSALVSGELASASGRRVGWSLPDRDLALIDVQDLSVRYVSGLMNLGMALAVNPASGDYSLVGTDAHNQIRFEPKVNGRFIDVRLARVDAAGGVAARHNLNPQVDPSTPRLPREQRALALGDPRAIVWRGDGALGWVAGLGSNNVLPVDAEGRRAGAPIAVGEGPAGLAWDADRQRLYVWNHFEASLSVVDPAAGREVARLAAFNPLPSAIREGRRFLYDTHLTSGQGHVACASCHIDGRMDRLAWDLGDPSAPPAPFDQNCVTSVGDACEDFHAMKGPMTTQTLQDIIGHEPHHWRGDRAGIEAFNPAFEGLLGDDEVLSAADMQRFEDFLATLHFPPNPYRQLDNSLPRALPLPGHYTSGRFALAGQPLPPGDALRGLSLFTQGLLDPPFQCASCHTLPTGMAVNGPLFVAFGALSAGGTVMAPGPHGENHLGIVSTDGSTNVSIKVAQLRNQHEKVGFDTGLAESRAGFGFLHDGSVDSLSRFFSARVFTTRSDQDTADLVALNLAFSGSEFPIPNPRLGAEPPLSKDSHAAVGQQAEHRGGAASARLNTLLQMARGNRIDLVLHASTMDYRFEPAGDRLLPADGGASRALGDVLAEASESRPQRWTAVPRGLGERIGRDRDGDGLPDRAEVAQGSDPADAGSTTLRPVAGLWFNPQRPGHGFDLEHLGSLLALTWYTYDEAGEPVWYQAVGEYANPWRGDLQRYRWDAATQRASGETVGAVELDFAAARALTLRWQLGDRSGSEPMQPLLQADRPPAPDRTGIYYDANEPGWGLSVYSEGDDRGALMYYYDADGAPRWALGLGDNRAADETVPMSRFRGFCPHCPVVEPSATEVGALRWQFDGTRPFLFDSTVDGWPRSAVPLEPLSDPVADPRWR